MNIRQPRVCMLVFNTFVHEARVLKEAETLASNGASVSILALRAPGLHSELALGEHICLRRIAPAAPFGDYFARLSTLMRLLALLLHTLCGALAAWRTRADVYHAHDFETLPALWVVARLRSAYLVYDAHEIAADRESFRAFAPIIRAVEGWLCRRVDGMLSTTDMRADHFAETYAIPRPTVLQNRPRFEPLLPSAELRERLDLRDEKPIVLYQGTLHAGRGLENLVELATRLSECHFVVIGSGKQAGWLQAEIPSRGLVGRLHHLPAVPFPELRELTAGADIGIHLLQNTCLNHYTTDSNKLFEYIAAGLAVVMPSFPEIRAIVERHGVGVLVDPSSLYDILRGLRLLIDNKDLLERCRSASRIAAKTLTWENQEQKLLELYARFK